MVIIFCYVISSCLDLSYGLILPYLILPYKLVHVDSFPNVGYFQIYPVPFLYIWLQSRQ